MRKKGDISSHTHSTKKKTIAAPQKMSFKDLCAELVEDRHMQIRTEFESKQHCSSMKEAYPNIGERLTMLRLFKAAGLYNKSWKRSCGVLTTTDSKAYKKEWNAKNKDKHMLHNLRYLLKKYGAPADPVTATVTATAVD